MTTIESNTNLEIWAGPCSVNANNLSELFQIADLRVRTRQGEMQRGVRGSRVVGLKSRTEKQNTSDQAGMDLAVYTLNQDILYSGGSIHDLITPPSVLIAKELVATTGVMVLTEIMDPWVQMPTYVRAQIPPKQALFWNPAVMQLGFPLSVMARFASDNEWDIGIKNGKWLGEDLAVANSPDCQTPTSMETTWSGLETFAVTNGRVFFIERGVDVPGKGRMRNAATPEVSRRVKNRTHGLLAYDASHEFGPNYSENEIIAGIIAAIQMLDQNGGYLYHAVLLEVGNSTTDKGQHISIDGLQYLTQEAAKIRDLVPPKEPSPRLYISKIARQEAASVI